MTLKTTDSIKVSAATGITALVLLISPGAFAGDAGWYIGGNIGQTKAEIDDKKITESLLGNGFITTSIDDDNRDSGYKLFGGYQFGYYFAIEAAYVDLGKFGFTAHTLPAGTLDSDIRLKGLGIDAVGILPLAENFSAFGRLGLSYMEAKDTFSGSGAVIVLAPDPDKRDVNLKAGLGVQYDFTPAFGMRIEAERYRINDAIDNTGDVDLASIGLTYRFNQRRNSAASVQCPEAQPSTQCPAPLVIIPASIKTEEYCTLLDIQFEIDMDDIQREEKERLEVIGAFLTKYPTNTAVIEGHTDNIGTKEYNLELSLHRASSVVNYLVRNFAIDASRLTAVGYGDQYPLASNDTEEGKRMNRRIDAVIACATDIEGLEVAPARTTMAMEIAFEKNRADVNPVYHNHLDKVARFLKANPYVTATVEGHAANLNGTQAEMLDISQRRAQNVVDYLVNNLGVARSQLSAEGFGKTRRFAYNRTVEGQQENRRVNIIFNYQKSKGKR